MTEPLRPVSTDQHFYADHSTKLDRLGDLLAEQNELLRTVLTDRQAAQPEQPDPVDDGPVAVELREPEPTPTTDMKPARQARGGRRSTKASN